MQIRDLDGNISNWKPKGREVTEDTRPRSQLHLIARQRLKEKFPTLQILEEVPFVPKRGKTLFFDFFLPLRKMAVEVNGEQHYKFSNLYHNSPLDFMNQKKNDMMKQEWCEMNGITLVILPYDMVPWSELI